MALGKFKLAVKDFRKVNVTSRALVYMWFTPSFVDDRRVFRLVLWVLRVL